MERVHRYLHDYLEGETWFRSTYGKAAAPLVAYFSMEFGLTECLPIYSGGLGVLAGDHLKSASDLGVPLVGVGLLYQQGYFQQYLNADGWQQERYPENDFHNLPVRPGARRRRQPVTIAVQLGRPDGARPDLASRRSGGCRSTCWTPTFPRTARRISEITAQLYGGDQEMRIRQEIVLGIGGHAGARRRWVSARCLPHERGALRRSWPRADPAR